MAKLSKNNRAGITLAALRAKKELEEKSKKVASSDSSQRQAPKKNFNKKTERVFVAKKKTKVKKGPKINNNVLREVAPAKGSKPFENIGAIIEQKEPLWKEKEERRNYKNKEEAKLIARAEKQAEVEGLRAELERTRQISDKTLPPMIDSEKDLIDYFKMRGGRKDELISYANALCSEVSVKTLESATSLIADFCLKEEYPLGLAALYESCKGNSYMKYFNAAIKGLISRLVVDLKAVQVTMDESVLEKLSEAAARKLKILDLAIDIAGTKLSSNKDSGNKAIDSMYSLLSDSDKDAVLSLVGRKSYKKNGISTMPRRFLASMTRNIQFHSGEESEKDMALSVRFDSECKLLFPIDSDNIDELKSDLELARTYEGSFEEVVEVEAKIKTLKKSKDSLGVIPNLVKR